MWWCGGGGREEVFSSFVAFEGNEYRWRLFTKQGGRGENRQSIDSSLESSAQTMTDTENVCTVTTSVGGTYNYPVSRLTAAVRQRTCATDGHQSSGPQYIHHRPQKKEGVMTSLPFPLRYPITKLSRPRVMVVCWKF